MKGGEKLFREEDSHCGVRQESKQRLCGDWVRGVYGDST